jgi:hypothetical protein
MLRPSRNCKPYTTRFATINAVFTGVIRSFMRRPAGAVERAIKPQAAEKKQARMERAWELEEQHVKEQVIK